MNKEHQLKKPLEQLCSTYNLTMIEVMRDYNSITLRNERYNIKNNQEHIIKQLEQRYNILKKI